MNDVEIAYPNRSNIENWIELLRDENVDLRLKLPVDSEDWYDHVLATIERIKSSYIPGLYEKATRLFYYLNKGHNFVDGNKRTSIIITYLFLLLNYRFITSPNRMEALAKKTARSKGSRQLEYWMREIQKELQYISQEMAR